MSNTSASGGYLSGTVAALPGSLTLVQFIHNFIAGVTGISNTLVRPNWQIAPPKQPDVTIDWVAYGININGSPVNAYVNIDQAGVSTLQRQEGLEIQCSFYGPAALDNASVFRDGMQIQQNLEVLQLANMGFKDCSTLVSGPDLVNERWIQRYIVSVTLVRLVQRTYPILSFASVGGTIHTVVSNENLEFDWAVTLP